VAGQLVKALLRKRIHVKGARVLVMGLTFKENCPDLRNTRVVDVIDELQDYGVNVDVYDPWVDADEAQHEYGITPIEAPVPGTYDGIVLAVAHEGFAAMGAAGMRRLGRDDHVLYDLKYLLPKDQSDLRL
jgi:UDP-N-acetyl-D-galactosamine dehydrogenase